MKKISMGWFAKRVAVLVLFLFVFGGVVKYHLGSDLRKEEVLGSNSSVNDTSENTHSNADDVSETKESSSAVEAEFTEILIGTAETGKRKLYLDNELLRHWGFKNIQPVLDATMRVVSSLHGRFWCTNDVQVFWDQRQSARNSKGYGHVVAETKVMTGKNVTQITFFHKSPLLMTLAHELSHANIADMRVPNSLNEGIAVFVETLVSELLARDKETSLEELILMDWSTQARSDLYYLISSVDPRQPGLEPTVKGCFFMSPTGPFQYYLAGHSILRIFCDTFREQNKRSVIYEYLAWKDMHRNEKPEKDVEFFLNSDYSSSYGAMHHLTLFKQYKSGLYAFWGIGSPHHNMSSIDSAFPALHVFYRNGDDRVPPVAISWSSQNGVRVISIPRAGATILVSGKNIPNELWVEGGRSTRIIVEHSGLKQIKATIKKSLERK